jgi:hypothetical protein
MALTAAALVLAGRRGPGRAPLAALALVGLTLGAHTVLGFLPGGGRVAREYREPRPTGLATLRAARSLRKDGLLVTDDGLAVFAANRADLLPWRLYDPGRWRADVVFFALNELDRSPQGPVLTRMLRGNESGVEYFDGWFVIAHAGAPTSGNAAVLAAATARPRTILFAFTRRQAGTEVLVHGGFIARYWRGDTHWSPLIARGDVHLDAGPHRAVLRYRADGNAALPNGFGVLRLYREGATEWIVELPLAPTGGTEYHEALVHFQLPAPSRVEARVWGGRLAAWLDRLVFERSG